MQRPAFLAIPTVAFVAAVLHGCGDMPSPDSPHNVRSDSSSRKGASLSVGLPKLPWAMPNPVPWTNDGIVDALLHCPPGYISKTHSTDTVKVQKLILAGVGKALSDCGFRCDNTSSCKAFMFGSEEKRCVVLHSDEPGDGLIRDYHFCLKMKPRQFGSSEAPLLRPSEYMQQEHAEIEVGEDIRIYAVGSSSLLWMTWLDQLHLVLRRLGYRLPVVPSKIGARLYTLQAPTCDDSQYFEYLRTTRYAKIGWSSWDFGFEGWEGCKTAGEKSMESKSSASMEQAVHLARIQCTIRRLHRMPAGATSRCWQRGTMMISNGQHTSNASAASKWAP